MKDDHVERGMKGCRVFAEVMAESGSDSSVKAADLNLYLLFSARPFAEPRETSPMETTSFHQTPNPL